MKKKIVKKKKKNFFFFFFFLKTVIFLSRGTSRDRGACPGIFAAALVPGQRDSGTRKLFLSRDKGTAGQGNFFVPGQRDNGTSRPLETLVSVSKNTEVVSVFFLENNRINTPSNFEAIPTAIGKI
jgi:hypothetical protein